MSDERKPEPALRLVLLALCILLVGAEATPVGRGTRVASPAAPARAALEPGVASPGAAGVVPTASGYRVSTASLTAHLTAEGVRVAPHQGGSSWSWRLSAVESGGEPVAGVDRGPVPPVETAPGVIDYGRGSLVERYLVGPGTIEQQFVIPAPLHLAGRDLLIAGKVTGPESFSALASGWRWGERPGAVSLGKARAHDAGGRELLVALSVMEETTRLVIDGTALAAARYPVTIDPEIGADDFRISEMGTHGDPIFFAASSAVAYNSARDEYLVVWDGNDDLSDGREIYAQRLDRTGAEIGEDDLKISSMGDGDSDREANAPRVAYNGVDDEYLVVWWGDEISDGEQEIYGQRLDASTAAELGENDFPISADFGDADWAAAAHNPAEDEYLVVWEGLGGVIYGQRLDGATGAEVGEDDFQISDQGQVPSVVYNPQDEEYLVVWKGGAAGEAEIHGQRLDGATGAEVGVNDFRLSQVGPEDDVGHSASVPRLAHNPTADEYLVVFTADPVVTFCFEIYGQRYTPGLFEDDFEDGEIAGWWAFPRGTWSEEQGMLVGEAVGGAETAALAVAAGFEGCERCRVTAELEVTAAESPAGPDSPAGPVAASLVGWLEGPADQVLVSLETDTDTVRLVERENGAVVAEASAVASLEPDTLYELAVSFDGELFRVGLDREVVIEVPSGAADLPSGRFALAVRNADLAVETFHVVGPDGG